MPLLQKRIFVGVKYGKNCILTLNLTFSGQLGSLITSRHAFRSSQNFQKLMQVRYTSDLVTFQVVETFQDQGVHKIVKKTCRMFFFQFLMLSISSVKELLHKPSEIQWNISGTLPGKLKREIPWALSYKILPPEITKMWEIAIFWGTLGAWEPICNSMVFYDFVDFWMFQPISFG